MRVSGASEAAVTSVNGDTGPLVVLDAGEVGADPTGTATAAVGAHVALPDPHSQYALRLFLGDAKVVNSLADLDVHAPAIAGMRTVTGILLITTIITLPLDDWFAYSGTGVILGLSSARCQIIGNRAGPLFSGSVVMSHLAVVNASVDAAASVFAITAAGGRTVRIEYCAIGTGAKAGTVSNILGALSFDRVFMNGCAGGFVFSGVLAAIELKSCAGSAMPAASIMFDFGATANVIRALAIEACALISTAATDRMIRIHSSATLPGGALPTIDVGVNILGNKVTGPSGSVGKLYDTGITTYDPQSARIIFNGNPSWPNSRFLGDADFADAITPIVTTYVGPAPTPFVPLARENVGPAAVLTLLPLSSKFTLIPGPTLFEWYLRFDGPVPIFAEIKWSATIEAAGGGGVGEFIDLIVEVQLVGIGAWIEVPGTRRRVEQRNVETLGTGSAYAEITPADRFRLSSSNGTGTNSTEVFQYDLIAVEA